MVISNFYLRIGNLGWLEVFLLPFVIGNHDTSLFLGRVGKPYLMSFGGKSPDYYENGMSRHLVRIFVILFCLFPTSRLLV